VSDTLAAFFRWIEDASLPAAIRESIWLYPFIEIIHIFGIVLVAGGAIFFDLHLLSLKNPLVADRRPFRLLTWSKRGLLIAIPSGLLLFSTNATSLAVDPVFWTKLSLLLLAAVNAWIFHVRVYLPYYHYNDASFRWPVARVNAVFSIVLWMSIIACGRLLAY
jgi:hypothetical protein